MFKKLFVILGLVNEDLDVRLQKAARADKFLKLPKDINQLDRSYRELVRELAKR